MAPGRRRGQGQSVGRCADRGGLAGWPVERTRSSCSAGVRAVTSIMMERRPEAPLALTVGWIDPDGRTVMTGRLLRRAATTDAGGLWHSIAGEVRAPAAIAGPSQQTPCRLVECAARHDARWRTAHTTQWCAQPRLPSGEPSRCESGAGVGRSNRVTSTSTPERSTKPSGRFICASRARSGHGHEHDPRPRLG